MKDKRRGTKYIPRELKCRIFTAEHQGGIDNGLDMRISYKPGYWGGERDEAEDGDDQSRSLEVFIALRIQPGFPERRETKSEVPLRASRS